jgi:diguanylate cyclase (GGDEF)-like protein
MTKKSLIRRNFSVLPADKPHFEELEVFKKEKERFLTAVTTRWYILGALAVFFVLSFLYFLINQSFNVAFSAFTPYFVLTALITAYNYILYFYHEKFAVIKGATHFQIVLDIFFVSVFLYLSGGVISWLWVLYPVLIFETAFLFKKGKDAWAIAFVASMSYFLVLIIQSFQGIIQTTFPFTILVPAEFSVYATVISFWVLSVNFLAASTGLYLNGIIFEKEQDLGRRVITDGLTGLYDHNYFYYCLEAEIRRSARYNRSFSLILIDIDNFKIYNDHFGHQKGDWLLRKVSESLSQNIRTKGVDLIFRYGGEEFAIIVPEIKEHRGRPVGAVALAERLRKKINDSIKITVSIGVGSYPLQGTTTTELFNNVDMALFEAKHKGKNRVAIAKVKRREKAA